MTRPEPSIELPRRALRCARALASVAAIAALLSPLSMTGCSKKKEAPKPVAVKPPPPPPPAPTPVNLDSVRASVDVDARVQFPQSQAPVDEDLARSIFELTNALAKLDAQSLASVLSPAGQTILDEVASEWYDEQVEGVRVVFISPTAKTTRNAADALVVTAIADNTGDPMVLAWSAQRQGTGPWQFTPAPATDATRPTLSAWDNLGPFEYEGESIAARFPEPAPIENAAPVDPNAPAPAPGSSTPRPTQPGKRTPTGIVPVPTTTPGG